MAASHFLTSFDFDHDEDLRNLLVSQSTNHSCLVSLACKSL